MRKTFESWMARVDALISVATGCSADDLPDVGYRDMYEDGRSAESAAKAAIRAAKEEE